MVDILADPEMVGFKRRDLSYSVERRVEEVEEVLREVYGSDAANIKVSDIIYKDGKWVCDDI